MPWELDCWIIPIKTYQKRFGPLPLFFGEPILPQAESHCTSYLQNLANELPISRISSGSWKFKENRKVDMLNSWCSPVSFEAVISQCNLWPLCLPATQLFKEFKEFTSNLIIRSLSVAECSSFELKTMSTFVPSPLRARPLHRLKSWDQTCTGSDSPIVSRSDMPHFWGWNL